MQLFPTKQQPILDKRCSSEWRKFTQSNIVDQAVAVFNATMNLQSLRHDWIKRRLNHAQFVTPAVKLSQLMF